MSDITNPFYKQLLYTQDLYMYYYTKKHVHVLYMVSTIILKEMNSLNGKYYYH